MKRAAVAIGCGLVMSLINSRALASCPSAPNAALVARRAVQKWSESKDIVVTGKARVQILNDFCLGIGDIGNKAAEVPKQALNRATKAAITSYLDSATRADQVHMSLDATIREELGFGGLARPTPAELGELVVAYRHSVKYVVVDGVKELPVTKFLVVVGWATFTGFGKKRQVCSVRVRIEPAMREKLAC